MVFSPGMVNTMTKVIDLPYDTEFVTAERIGDVRGNEEVRLSFYETVLMPGSEMAPKYVWVRHAGCVQIAGYKDFTEVCMGRELVEPRFKRLPGDWSGMGPIHGQTVIVDMTPVNAMREYYTNDYLREQVKPTLMSLIRQYAIAYADRTDPESIDNEGFEYLDRELNNALKALEDFITKLGIDQ